MMLNKQKWLYTHKYWVTPCFFLLPGVNHLPKQYLNCLKLLATVILVKLKVKATILFHEGQVFVLC